MLFACSAGHTSGEDQKLHSGFLTYFLIDGLRGAADTDQDGTITANDLYAFARERVSAYTKNQQVPDFRRDPADQVQAAQGATRSGQGRLPVPVPPRSGDGTPGGEAGFQSLFNGQDLNGWQAERGLWEVEDGVIVGRSQDYRTRSFLLTEREYSDFVLRLEFNLDPGTGMPSPCEPC